MQYIQNYAGGIWLRTPVLAIVSILWFHPKSIAQETAELFPARDNTIYLDVAGNPLSNGAGNHLFTGKSGDGRFQRALLYFDIAAIPEDAVIENVSLRLNRSMVAPQGQDRQLALHRLLADWGEGASMAPMGEGIGAQPQAGDASWIHRFFPDDLWDTPGGDFDAEASAVTNSAVTTIFESAGMIADVQAWLDDPDTNFGWIITGDESINSTSSRFDSREHPLGENRPLLTVTYQMMSSVDKVTKNQKAILYVYPNPCADRCRISMSGLDMRDGLLTIYNSIGQVIRSIPVDQTLSTKIEWDRRDEYGRFVIPGLYYAVFQREVVNIFSSIVVH